MYRIVKVSFSNGRYLYFLSIPPTSYHHFPLLSQNLWELFVTLIEKERSHL